MINKISKEHHKKKKSEFANKKEMKHSIFKKNVNEIKKRVLEKATCLMLVHYFSHVVNRKVWFLDSVAC